MSENFTADIDLNVKGEQSIESAIRKIVELQTEIKKAEQSATALSKTMSKTSSDTAASATQAKGAMSGVGDAAENTGRKVREAGAAGEQSWKKQYDTLSNTRYALYDVAALWGTVKIAALGTVAATTGIAASYEKSFSSVARTTLAQGEALASLRADLIDLSTEMPLAFSDISGIATLGAQLGVANEDISRFTETVGMFAATTDVTVDAAATSIGRLAQLTSTAGADYERLASAIYATGISAVATEGEILAVSEQIATSGDLAGLANYEIVALASALASLGVQPEAARGSLMRIFNVIENGAASGGDALQKIADISGMSMDAIQKNWGTNSQEVFSAFVEGLGGMQDAGQNTNNMLQEMGIGAVRDIRALQVLANNTEVYNQALADTQEAYSSGTALQDGYAVGTDTLVDRLTKLKNSLMSLVAEGSNFNEYLKGAVDIINSFLGLVQDVTSTPVGKFFLGVAASLAVLVAGFAGLQIATALARGGLAAYITATEGLARAGAPLTLGLKGITREFYALATGGEVARRQLLATGTAMQTTTAKTFTWGGALQTTAAGARNAIGILGGFARTVAPIAAVSAAIYGLSKGWEELQKYMMSPGERAESYFGDLSSLTEAIKQDTEKADSSLRSMTVTVDDSSTKLKGWAQDLENSTGATIALSDATAETTAKTREFTVALGEASRIQLANMLVEKLIPTMDKWGSQLESAGFSWDTYIQKVMQGGTQGQQYLDTFATTATARLAEIDQALAAGASGDFYKALLTEQDALTQGLVALEEATSATSGAIDEASLRAALSASAYKAAGVEVTESLDDMSGGAEDLGNEMDTLGSKISDFMSSATSGADVAKAFNDIGEALYNNGTSFDQFTQNGIANTEALKSTITSLADSAGEDSGLFVANIAGLMQGLQAQGVDTTNELGWVYQLLNQVAGNQYGIDFSTLPARQNIAQFIADLIAAEQAVVNAQRQMAAEQTKSLSMFPGFQHSVAEKKVDTSRLDSLLEIQKQIQNVSERTVPPVRQIASGYDNAARGANNTANNTKKAAKGAKELKREMRTTNDYASDLDGVMSQVADTIFGMSRAKREIRDTFKGILDDLTKDSSEVQLDIFAFERRGQRDDMSKMFNDLKQAAKDAQKEVRDATLAVMDANAKLNGLRADKGTLDYQLRVAKALGTSERVAEIEAKIAQNKSDQAAAAAEVADAEERRQKAIKATSTKTTGTSDVAIENRSKLRDLAKGYMDYADTLRDAGVSEKEIQKYLKQSVKDFEAQAKQLGFTSSQYRTYSTGISAMSANIQKNSTTLKGNEDALDDLFNAHREAIVAFAQTGASQKQIAAFVNQSKKSFSDQAKQLGFSEAATKKYIFAFKEFGDVVRKLPSKVDIRTNVQNPSDAALRKFFNDWNNRKLNMSAQVNDNSAKNWRNKNTGGKGISKKVDIPIQTSMNGSGSNRAAQKRKYLALYWEATAKAMNALDRGDFKQHQAWIKKANGYKATHDKYYKGGFTGRGGKYEEAGVVHRGEYVFQKSEVDQSTGQPKPEALLSMLPTDFMYNGSQLPSVPAGNTINNYTTGSNGPTLVELVPANMQSLGRLIASALVTDSGNDFSKIAHAVNSINRSQTNKGNG